MKLLVWCRIEKRFYIVKNLGKRYNQQALEGFVLPELELLALDRTEVKPSEIPANLQGKLTKTGCVIGTETIRG